VPGLAFLLNDDRYLLGNDRGAKGSSTLEKRVQLVDAIQLPHGTTLGRRSRSTWTPFLMGVSRTTSRTAECCYAGCAFNDG
jgi:hypothetical protein